MTNDIGTVLFLASVIASCDAQPRAAKAEAPVEQAVEAGAAAPAAAESAAIANTTGKWLIVGEDSPGETRVLGKIYLEQSGDSIKAMDATKVVLAKGKAPRGTVSLTATEGRNLPGGIVKFEGFARDTGARGVVEGQATLADGSTLKIRLEEAVAGANGITWVCGNHTPKHLAVTGKELRDSIKRYDCKDWSSQ